MDDAGVYANLLYANLVSASPKATYNMANNITFQELNDRYIITISRGVPYARYTTRCFWAFLFIAPIARNESVYNIPQF